MLKNTLPGAACLSLLIAVFSTTVFAGSLAKRSRVELKIGRWHHGSASQAINRIGPYTVQTSAKSGGAFGTVSYTYWTRENFAVTFALSALRLTGDSRVEFGDDQTTQFVGFSENQINVVPFVFGFKYYPLVTSPARPFFSMYAGPYIGFEAQHKVEKEIVQNSRTLNSVGSRIGGGIDVRLNRRFMLGAEAGYNFVMGFTKSLSGRDNYSGPELSFGLSLLFGKGQ